MADDEKKYKTRALVESYEPWSIPGKHQNTKGDKQREKELKQPPPDTETIKGVNGEGEEPQIESLTS